VRLANLGCTLGLSAAVAMLFGCGALQQAQDDMQPPIDPYGGPSSATVGKDQSLLYVSDPPAGDVYMVTLPSGRLAGKLTGLSDPSGDCADQHGNVFVDNTGDNQVRAYAHGAKSAFRVLNDAGWEPNGCTVDATTGNLAVCNAEGSIAIYFNAKGAAHYYQYSGVDSFWYCAYDDHGNLFADTVRYGSEGGSDNPVFLELPNGRGKLQPISLSPAITGNVSPPLFWDGKHLAIASTTSGVIYQYQISGSTGARVGIVKLDDAGEVFGPFWISPNGSAQMLYAPVVKDSIESVGVYRYPAGGKRLQNIYDAPIPFAAAVSTPK
jgi:hypothetical protein